jgi:hypothetical protein
MVEVFRLSQGMESPLWSQLSFSVHTRFFAFVGVGNRCFIP